MKHVSLNLLFVEFIITGQNLNQCFSEFHGQSFCSICSCRVRHCGQLKVLSLHEPEWCSAASLPALGCKFFCATCRCACGGHSSSMDLVCLTRKPFFEQNFKFCVFPFYLGISAYNVTLGTVIFF